MLVLRAYYRYASKQDAAAAAAAAEGRKGKGSLGKEIKIEVVEHPSSLEISNLLLISLVYVCSRESE